MSLNDAKMPTLKKKLEEKIELEVELEKVEDEISDITNPKKVKISKSKKK